MSTVPDSTTDAPAAAEILPLDQSAVPASSAYRFSPLVSWLVATTRPDLTVELGSGDEASLVSTCEAILRANPEGACVAVFLPAPSDPDPGAFEVRTSALADRFGPAFRSYDSAHAALAALPVEGVALVHVSLLDSDDSAVTEVAAWHQVMAPGAVLIVTTTASDASSSFAKAKAAVMDAYPAVSILLGLTTEAVVAQRPGDDGAPIVEMLRKAPTAVGAFLTLFGEQTELQALLHDEPEPSEAMRALIGRVIDQQHAERETFLSALRIYKEETVRLSNEVEEVRSELIRQIDAARLEREHVVAEFLDRVDELSAKVSTTASRYSAALADRDALLEAEGRKVEDYAGQAAVAQSVVDDIHRSTSWRITAPVRLLSRMLARRALPPAQPEN